MKIPCVSWLISVYNGEAYLAQAMDSIVCQTYTDWECVVIDDCSTDNTPAILAEYARRDERIRVYRNERNLRLAGSLNRAMGLARGRYLVRMDADDVCRPDRLEKQVAFMDAHPDADMSYCRCLLLRDGAVLPATDLRRTDAAAIRALLLFFNPVFHNCVILRRETLGEMKYDPACTCTEDLDLWTRMACEGKRLAVQEDYLMLYRLHGGQVTATSAQRQREEYRRIIGRFYGDTLFPLGEGDTAFLAGSVFFRDTLAPARQLSALLRRIWAANREKAGFDRDALRYAFFELLMEYRRAGVSAAALLPALARLGPGFLAGEYRRRRAARGRDQALRQAAADAFRREGSAGL